MYWAGMDSRYSGARRGIGALGSSGCRGILMVSRGVLGAGRDCRYSGARSIGGIRGHLVAPWV